VSEAPIIAALAMNPSIDADFEVEHVTPTHKLRTTAERYQPGGGGINVAIVIDRLGGHGQAQCFYLSGGATGATLEALIDTFGFAHRSIPIADHTRICCNVVELSTGREFRFVPPGPRVSEVEWQSCLQALGEAEGDYLVASGSLPRGVPTDFYARVTETARAKGMRMVLDTSGEALKQGLAGGGIYLVKPSQEELEQVVGHKLADVNEIARAAMEIVESGHAELVAVTMGADGALLASREGSRHLPAIEVEARSAVGAGDSFVAAMVHRLSQGHDPIDAFRYGMAAGAAAVMTPGTEMCHPEDVERLYRESLAD
jgi:6-phosphofructokinase 2